jgi:hypothetical protein
MLGAIRRRDDAWFVRRVAGCRVAIFGSHDERRRFDLSYAEDIARSLLAEKHDVAIVCEAFPSLGL